MQHSDIRHILCELRKHAPFTALGALIGIALFVGAIYLPIPPERAYAYFYLFHPLHVFLSAAATAGMYRLHLRQSPIKAVLVGYAGSIGIATISDSAIPYLGEFLLRMPNRGIHIGVVEEWFSVNLLAFAGIAIALAKQTTKVSHCGHVLISTLASLSHILMARDGTTNLVQLVAMFVFLFLAVWLPCCVSDIVFPLLFVRSRKINKQGC